MADTIGDTGPILHLHEIDAVEALASLRRILIPPLVVAELETFRLTESTLSQAVSPCILEIVPVDEDEARRSLHGASDLQAADLQVLYLARTTAPGLAVLTDDLALRHHVESAGGAAVGSLGLLIRSYRVGRMSRPRLEELVDRLMTESSLYMSRPFRAYVRSLISGIE